MWSKLLYALQIEKHHEQQRRPELQQQPVHRCVEMPLKIVGGHQEDDEIRRGHSA
jgi:hypothetical protein